MFDQVIVAVTKLGVKIGYSVFVLLVWATVLYIGQALKIKTVFARVFFIVRKLSNRIRQTSVFLCRGSKRIDFHEMGLNQSVGNGI